MIAISMIAPELVLIPNEFTAKKSNLVAKVGKPGIIPNCTKPIAKTATALAFKKPGNV